MHTINHKQTNHAISQLPTPSAYRLIYLLLFILFTSSVQAQGLFDSLELQQVLYKDAAHAYDDDQVILLSRQRVPQLSSRLVPVQTGDEITLSTFVHYSSAPAHKTWQKIGAAAAGLAIGSLPHLLDRNKANQEGSGGNDLLKKAAPLAGAGVAALPFVLNKRKGKTISKNTNKPRSKNGLFVPDAYLSYTFYDLDGKVLTSDVQSIDKNAKDAWQQLSLHAIAPQDGYVQVEVGNGSKRPVWVDGFEYTRKRRSEKTTTESRMRRMGISSEEPSVIPIDTAFSQLIGEDDTRWPESPDIGPRPGPNYVKVCNEICIDRIPGYNYQGQTEYYCWDDCVWEYVEPPAEATKPDIDNGDNPDDGSDPGGGDSPENENSDPTQEAPIRNESLLFRGDECSALNMLYSSSFLGDGSVWRENSAWITEAGVILLPNDDNTSRYSNNNDLRVRPKNGGYEVEYPKGSNSWHWIYAYVHTHPNSDYGDYRDARPGGVNNSTNTRDWEFAEQFPGLTNYIISTSVTYRYRYDPNSNQRYSQQNIGNSSSFLECEKSLSNYYY